MESTIFTLSGELEFRTAALEIFRYQMKTNPVYSKFFHHLRRGAERVRELEEIPFLPIEMFREHQVIAGNLMPSVVFASSGTTGEKCSKHYVVSEQLYQKSFLQNFQSHIGDPANLCILALLPSYLERGDSSLVYMMNHLIAKSSHPDSGFYLNNFDELADVLKRRSADGYPTLLLGVSFALLDLAERYPHSLPPTITVMETGGMKGRRKEMIREELHAILRAAFGKEQIQSEYGMTELLSQAYAANGSRFVPPPWMKVLVRDMYDPFALLPAGQSGGINIIDLANIYSCSFLATGDLGVAYDDGSFEITGRFDQSDVRGCNLMVY